MENNNVDELFANNSSADDNIKYYKYSSGKKASRWDIDLETESISVNFSEYNIGTLNQYDTIDDLALKMGVDAKKSNHCWNLWLFREAKVGDVIIANNGVMQILGFGIITGPYEYYEDRSDFKHSRTVKWIATELFDYVPNTIPKYSELLRRDTFSTTKVAKQIVSMYLNIHPEFMDVFKENRLIGDDFVPFENWKDNTNMNENFKFVEIEYPAAFNTHGQFQKNFRRVLEIPDEINKVTVKYNDILYEGLTLGQEGAGTGRIYFPNFGKQFISNNPQLIGGEKITIGISWENFTARETVAVKNDSQMNKSTHPLNTILYGPPGTGKTYNSIYHALSIIEKKTIEELKEEEYDVIKDRFDLLLIKDHEEQPQKGRIGFVTFHQSLSYEDFIEGIKPMLTDGSEGEVNYTIKSGIFKYLSSVAKVGPIEKSNPDFDNSYAALLSNIKAQQDEKLVLNTLNQEKPFTIYINSKNNLKFHANTEKAYVGVIKKDIIKTYLETGNALDWTSYTPAVGEYIRENFGYSKLPETNIDNTKPYVLIIDEINRGNVSQIFGELITLIENNKREGEKEALGVTLPYSKDFFTVPSNLFIVATMNTADRSVEALDSALRRRFTFEHIPPDYSTLQKDGNDIEVGEISLPKLLKTINERIAYLLDEDHQIGHSYFMTVDDAGKLKDAFNKAIIPLLKEYFYNDYEKIYWILGSGFVEKAQNDKNIFNIQEAVLDMQDRYIIKDIKDNFPIVEALNITINGKQ